MYYLVNMDHKRMAVHLTRSDCEGFCEVLYIQYSGCDRYVEEWQWRVCER